jgi:transcription antitermination factor NusG
MSKRWYVLHARSGYEAKVKTAIEEAIDREGLSDLLGDVMIPTMNDFLITIAHRFRAIFIDMHIT